MNQPANNMDDATVSHLVRLGIGAEGRPIDDVIARLEQPDGRRWLEEGAKMPPLSRVLLSDLRGLNTCNRTELESIKEESKRLAASRTSATDEHLRGLLAYFLALAAARLQHGVWMSSQPAERIASELGDLATALADDLATEVGRAAIG